MAQGQNAQDAGRASGAPGGTTDDREAPAAGPGPGRAHVAALAVVVLGGAALRLLHLDQPVRYDEAITYLRYVAAPLPEALSSYGLPNNHLFHTLLAHLSVEALGDRVPVLRLPAWIAGTLVVPAVYAVARALRGPGAALLAAAMAAASPVLVLFSANARGYSLVVLAFLVMVAAAAVLARRWSVPAWVGFVAAAALGAWTIPVMVYPAAAAAAWWVAAATSRGRSLGPSLADAAVTGLAAAAVAALLYLPVIRTEGFDALVANRFVTPRPLGSFVAAVPGFLAEVAREWSHGVPAWATGLAAAGAAAEGVVRLRGRAEGPPSLFPVALGSSLVVLAASRRTPFARVWLFLLPALMVFGASGLARLVEGFSRRVSGAPSPRSLIPAVGVLLAAVPGWHVHGGDVVRDWGLTGSLPAGDRVAAVVAEHWEPGDVVRAEIPSDAPLEFYFRRLGLPRTAVNGIPDPDGCVFVVVNHRHGQTLSGVAGTTGRGSSAPRHLRSWDGTSLYVMPETSPDAPGDGAGADACPAGERP